MSGQRGRKAALIADQRPVEDNQVGKPTLSRSSGGANAAPERPLIAFCAVADWEKAYFERAFTGYPLRFLAQPIESVPASDLADVVVLSVFIRAPITSDVLVHLPRLRMIATRSTGFDHIDLAACTSRGIIVSNVPHYGESTVAEFTFALMLALTRHLVTAVERTRQCDFQIEGLQGIDLRGKTLGVIGAGNIGLHVIRIARGFAMNVVAFDTRPQPLLAEVLGFAYVPLDELLARSDIVSLHVPGSAATFQLMNRDRFARLKKGAILINTARGTVVDSEALLWALDEGIVAAAGLDVVAGEELITEESELLKTPRVEDRFRQVLREHALLRHPNVIVTPHVAFDTCEALGRIAETTVTSIRSFLNGQPVDVVNPEVLSGTRATA